MHIDIIAKFLYNLLNSHFLTKPKPKGDEMAESMALRVKRIISGSINALIDAAEGINPQIVMKESIREVDGVISQIRHEMGKFVVEKNRLTKQIDDLNKRHKSLLEQIKIALKEGRDDLAEVAASKQINIEEQLPMLKESLSESNENIKKYEEYIKALQAKKRDMQDELSQFVKQASSPENPDNNNSISAAQEAFERVMGASSSNFDLSQESKLSELEDLARKNQVKERIEALRNTLDD